MIDEKIMEVLATPPDAALAIVTQGLNEPHVINSWNSKAQQILLKKVRILK
jgi:hypothetical protein